MKTLANSLAIFSLFFGAGNSVFPILLGLTEKSHLMPSFFGLVVSAIVLPCLGLIAVLFYKGSLKIFFTPLGNIPTKALTTLMAALLGPLAVMPRCVIVAHASIQSIGLNIPLALFSPVFCGVSLACLWKKSKIFDLLGKVLSPILVISLIAIIVSSTHNLSFNWSNESFKDGFLVGYNTLDLVAALFFAPSIFFFMKGQSSRLNLIISSILAFVVLALMYFGLASAASQSSLTSDNPAGLLGNLAMISLGPIGAYIACLSVALACLTTVVGLSLSLNAWLYEEKKDLTQNLERLTSFITLALCSILTFLGFEKIMGFLGNILFYLYPLLVIWCVYKLALVKRNS